MSFSIMSESVRMLGVFVLVGYLGLRMLLMSLQKLCRDQHLKRQPRLVDS
jgi:hypothetical protein